MATYYKWNKYNTEYKESSRNADGSEEIVLAVGLSAPPTVYLGTKKTLDKKTGRFSLGGDTDSGQVSGGLSTGYWDFGTYDHRTVYYSPDQDMSFQYRSGKLTVSSWTGNKCKVYTSSLGKGALVGNVYSLNASEFPDDGMKEIYWYDSKEAVSSPIAPSSVIYPESFFTDIIAVSWAAAESKVPTYPIAGYEVSYVLNGTDSWTVAGETNGTDYSIKVPKSTTSIKIRVRAKDTGGQWSEYITGKVSQVIIAPKLTVPALVMQNQKVPVIWTAVEGASSYTLQRKVDAGVWEEVYKGTNTNFNDTAAAWKTVQYQIQAVFDGVPGGWAASEVIQVVSASALVISGQDGDLGTITKDVPYTVSSDTGNPITLERYVNGSLVARLTVESGFAYSIPVMELPTGAGTIKLVCSVTPSAGGPVTATRIWGYTKAVVQFPDEGGPAVLQQDGKKVFAITLAECVKVPVNWGGSLDKSLELLLPLLNTAVMATGSYTGTGTFGKDNPNELTFTFDPEIVIVSGASGSITISNKEPSGGKSDGYIQNQKATWYATSASKQLNVQGELYSYWAVGKAVQT